MNAVLAFLGAKIGYLIAAGGLVMILPIAKRIIRRWIDRELSEYLKLALSPNNPNHVRREKFKKFAIAAVELAEDVIPDRGRGAEKKALVMKMLSRLVPSQAAEALSQLIEEAWASADDVLKGSLGDKKPE